MPEPTYTHRELELLFKRLEEKIDEIRQDIKETNTNFDNRLLKVEQKVERLELWQTKVLAVWSVAVMVAGWVLNRYF